MQLWDPKLQVAFFSALKAARKTARAGKHETRLNVTDALGAEGFLRGLRWKRRVLSPAWLEGSITDVSAPIGKAKIKEAYRLFDIGSRSAPRPGWEITLYKHRFGNARLGLETAEIDLVNMGGRFEIRLTGNYTELLPWLKLET